jgi:hypothetical protein
MTSQEFISMASSSWNMAHLLDRLGKHENTYENRTIYVYPLAVQAGLTLDEVRSLFIINVRKAERAALNIAVTPTVTPTITPSSTPVN